MTNTSTFSEEPLSQLELGLDSGECFALVIAWSRDEPGRIGETLLVPEAPVRAWVFGRGELLEDAPRLKLVRQRPGSIEPAGALRCPRISRAQLRVRPAGEALEIERIGRCPMLVNGRPVERLEVVPGDLIELQNELLLLVVRRSSLFPQLPEGAALPAHPYGEADVFGMVGESAVLWELRRQIVLMAAQSTHVLVLGASGTGKELVARAIHARSTRRGRSMIARNAATFPEGLIDAELFGNMRNYPNPGMPERSGLVGESDGSTLFLDEFAELPLALQAHLLRVMDEGEYQRLGESAQRHSDFRLIAATNRAPGELKHDILARLGWRLSVPDLNQRREDIPLLVRHLLCRMVERDAGLGRFFKPGPDPEPRVTPAMMRALLRHRYTTHIRELQALLLHAMSHTLGGYIDLCPGLPIDEQPLEPAGETPEVDADAIPPEVIQAALDRHNGVQAKVWQELGLKSRFVLIRLIKKYDLAVRPGGRSAGD